MVHLRLCPHRRTASCAVQCCRLDVFICRIHILRAKYVLRTNQSIRADFYIFASAIFATFCPAQITVELSVQCYCIVHLLLRNGLQVHQRACTFQIFWGRPPGSPEQEGDTCCHALPLRCSLATVCTITVAVDLWSTDFKSTNYLF